MDFFVPGLTASTAATWAQILRRFAAFHRGCAKPWRAEQRMDLWSFLKSSAQYGASSVYLGSVNTGDGSARPQRRGRRRSSMSVARGHHSGRGATPSAGGRPTAWESKLRPKGAPSTCSLLSGQTLRGSTRTPHLASTSSLQTSSGSGWFVYRREVEV